MNTVKTWAIDTGIRSIKTFAQTLAGLLGFSAIAPTSIIHVAWQADLGVAAAAAVACLLQNIQSFPTAAIDGTLSVADVAPVLDSTVTLIGPDSTPEPVVAPVAAPVPAVVAPDPAAAPSVTA